MSKYYKAEDVINAIEDKIAEYIPTLHGRYGEIPLELRMAIEHLPTIEVSEEDLKGCDKVDKRFSEDCISKAYLEQEIENHLLSTENLRTEKDEWWNKAFEVMVEIIEDAPSVVPSCQKNRQVERAEGEWIEHKRAEEYDGLLKPNYECSQCHDWLREQTNYCPNCGSRNLKESK